jgi:hypothetical protein
VFGIAPNIYLPLVFIQAIPYIGTVVALNVLSVAQSRVDDDTSIADCSVARQQNRFFGLKTHTCRARCLQTCPECGKEVANVRNHINFVHRRVRNFPCDQCDQTYISSLQLKQHIRAVHLGETAKCEVGFYFISGLWIRIRIGSGFNDFVDPDSKMLWIRIRNEEKCWIRI